MRAFLLGLTLVAGLCALSADSRAQSDSPYDGSIDFDRSIARQIRELEGMVRGDAAPSHQAVVLEWLAQLYTAVSDYDAVEGCYLRILSLYPSDVGVMNNYAAFLIDTKKDYQRADSLLMMTNRWARNIDERSVYRGRTWELWGQVAYIQKDYERSARRARNSLELLEGDARSESLRLAARSYTALGDYDAAAEAWIELIAIQRGAVSEDVNELQLIAPKTTKYSEGSIREMVARAVADAETARREQIESEGGSVVELRSDDGVVLEATLRRAPGPGAVLYIPDLGASRAPFTPYAQLLFIDDITTLSVDLRGHGASRADTLISYDALSPYHRDRLTSDVRAGYRHLRSLGFADPDIAVVSAGAGCAVVEKALRLENAAPAVTHLSPVFEPDDHDLMNAVAFHPDRPVIIIFSREDLGAMRSTQIFRNVKPRKQLETLALDRCGHGLETLHRSPRALDRVQTWTRRVTGTPGGSSGP